MKFVKIGILVWGIVFIVSGYFLLDFGKYIQQGALGRLQYQVGQDAEIRSKLVKALDNATNPQIVKNRQAILREYQIKHDNLFIFNDKLARTNYVMFMCLWTALCIFTGLLLILHREIGRKMALVLPIVLMGVSFYFLSHMLQLTHQAVVWVNFENFVIDAISENKAPWLMMPDSWRITNFTAVILQIGLIWFLIIVTNVWFLTKKTVREMFKTPIFRS